MTNGLALIWRLFVSDFIHLPMEYGIHANFQFIQFIEYNGQLFTQTLVKDNGQFMRSPNFLL